MKRSLAVGFCCIFFIATLAFGQSANTSLRGVVKDPSGALVPAATITLLDKATSNTYHAVSNSSGFYIFPVVAPAHYLITVASSGFATQTGNADLLVDQPATIDFTLSVSAQTVNINVNSAAQSLNFTDATIGNAVGNATIQALPMDARSPISLLSLQPGVLYMGQTPASADSRQGAVAGARSDQGNVTIDGLDDNDQINGYAFDGVLRSTLDSTEEFRVTTSNGTAAAGRSSGAEIDLITKSGTNRYHGALYEYNRPTNTVANDFFYKNTELSTPGDSNVPQKYIQNVFGGSLGGAVIKNKLFYFFNYEGTRIGTDAVIGATVPTTTFMQGELAYPNATGGGTTTLSALQVSALDAPCAGNKYNGAPICPWGPGADPNILSYYAHVPTAQPTTSPILGDGLNSGALFFTSPTPSTENTSILKIDYDLNSKNHIFVRGNLQKDTSSGAENLPGQPPSSFSDDNTKGIAVGHTWIPTARIVNDLRYGFIRQGYQTSGIGDGDYVGVYGLTQPTSQTRNTLLHVPVNNITDTLTWTKGAHTLAFGGNWRGITNHNSSDGNSFDSASTNYQYSSGAGIPNPGNVLGSSFATSWQIAYNDLMGVVPERTNFYNYQIAGPNSAAALADGAFITRNFRSNEFEYFVQDTWHPRSNLTLTFGLRHTILQTPYETNGQQVSPTINTDAWYKERESAALQSQVYEPLLSFAPSGKANGRPGFWPKQKANFAPRAGVVFSPNPRMSVRASAGMYFDHYGEALINSFDLSGGAYGVSGLASSQAGSLGVEATPRFTGANSLPNLTIQGAPPTTETFPFTPSPEGLNIDWGLDTRLKTPYAEAFDFSVQHELPGGFTFEEAYVGRLGRHLLQQIDLAEATDYVDPQGGGDYFTAGKQLSREVDNAPFGTFIGPYSPAPGSTQKVANVAPIPYFEHVFPYMANIDYMGESATQSVFNNAWSPLRYSDGETLSLVLLDFAPYGVFPNIPTQSRFLAPQFGSLYSLDSIGNSSYNALQFTLRHPAAHGLTVDFNYTFSKSLDLGSETERANVFTNDDGGFTNFGIQNTWNPKLNKGPSDFDTHSLFTGDWVYALPVGRGKAAFSNANRITDAFIGGWQWAGLMRWTSGLPFTLDSPAFPTNYENPAFAFNVGHVATKRNFIGGIPHAFDASTASAIGNGIYYGSPIRLPYPGEAGQRNNFRGDGYYDIDSSLAKSWRLGDWAALKFAAEAYNLTNSARFNTSLDGLNVHTSSAALGAYSSTLSTYRRMQFGLRLDF